MTNFDPWHLLHVITAAVVGGAAWVFQDHSRRDDQRFNMMETTTGQINAKLDEAITRMDNHHAEVLKILLNHKN